jgi:hypothetical protein
MQRTNFLPVVGSEVGEDVVLEAVRSRWTTPRTSR